MDENNPVNQGGVEGEKIEKLEHELEDIEKKAAVPQSAPSPSPPAEPTSPPSAPPQPIPPSPSIETAPQGTGKSKVVLWIGIALLALALIAAGAYCLGSRRNVPTVTPEPVPIQTPTPTPDPTADWKTYKSQVGIEFKYPNDWYAKLLSRWTFNVFLENRPFEIPEGTEFMTSIQVGFNEVMNTTTNEKFFQEKTLSEGVKRIKSLYDQKTVKVDSLTVGGKKAVQISGVWGPGMLEGQYFVETLVQMDNHLLMVSLTNKEFEDIYNQILSTFKFIEATPSATITP